MRDVIGPVRLAFLVGLAALVLLIVTKLLAEIIPESVAAHVSRNSEGMLALLALVGWMLYVRSRGDASPVRVVAMVAGGFAVLGVFLLIADVPSTLRALNEPVLALALLVVYTALPRPLPAWGWLLPIGTAVAVLTTSWTEFGTDLAETYFFLMLVPLGLDLFDRSILEPDRRPRRGLLVGWMVLLVAAPTMFSLVRPDQPYENIVEVVLRYMSRPTEAFLGVLLLHLFFLPDTLGAATRPFPDERG